MEINAIKKGLYREKPNAGLVHVKKDGMLYSCRVESDEKTPEGRGKYMSVYFLVPLSEIGEGAFLNEMPGQLLIRYLLPGDPSF